MHQLSSVMCDHLKFFEADLPEIQPVKPSSSFSAWISINIEMFMATALTNSVTSIYFLIKGYSKIESVRHFKNMYGLMLLGF